jgi:protein O-mannosyl-transferase
VPATPPRAAVAGAGTVAARVTSAASWIPVLLIVAGLAAYWNSFGGAFVFDDDYRIVDNPQIRRLWPLGDLLAKSARPVVDVSLAVNYAFDGLNVRGFHAVNLAIHILAGLALYGVVRRMLVSARLGARYGRSAPWLAGAAALIWLVHPLQTESVTYIIQRAESLMGLFYLLTLYCGIRGLGSSRSLWWFVAAIAASALGMTTKEVMVSAPIMMLLYDRLFVAASFREIVRRRWAFYAGLAATWALILLLLASSKVSESTGATAGLTPWRYLVTQLGVIVHYLRLSFWPSPLVLDYTWKLPQTVWDVLPSALVVLALAAGAVLSFRRLPLVSFWGAWFFLILAPSSSILPIADLAFEHRMYLPLAAIVVLVVVGTHEAIELLIARLGAPDALRRGVLIGLLLVVVLLLGATTVRRNEDYRSDVAIWTDTVSKRPDNARAQNNLGNALLKRERTEEAALHFAEAVRLHPGFPIARRNLGLVLLHLGRNKEAIAQSSEAIRLDPGSWDAHHELGVVLYREGQFDDAIAQYTEALRLKPAFPEAHHSLGLALNKQGKTDLAVAQFAEAVRLKPDYADAHNNLGALLDKRGQTKEAIAHFTEAIRLKPDYAQAHNNLGAALYREGQFKEAAVHFADAVRLKPDWAEPQANLRAAEAAQGKRSSERSN